MFGTPIIWLIVAALAAGGTWFGAYAIKKNVQIADARTEGIAIGTGKTATATLEAATKTAEAERLAEAETPLPANRAEVIALCKRRASCKERNQLK